MDLTSTKMVPEPAYGSKISAYARVLVDQARAHGRDVCGSFNNITLAAGPNSDPEQLEETYWQAVKCAG
jgi:hypothetical protein